MQEYCGDVLNFKTYSKSHKNKKRIPNDKENWVIFKDVHEPIIDRVIWEQVQEKRGKIRRRKTKDGERNMFCGVLVCADCGRNLNYHFNQGNHDIKYLSPTNRLKVSNKKRVFLQDIKSYKNTRYGTPEGTRTPNPRNRNPMLYPLSHRCISL